MTTVLKKMDNAHYTLYISTFKTRQDIIATLVPEPDLRKAIIPIFFDMMQCEHNFSLNHTFQMVSALSCCP
ncbi:hypothetical protein AAFF_G00376060 [Aldrovandia affinis]|uniref:Dedicator of cytokinesis TPR repeats region domain-containing protein n=1 Tax=Aldrovandia affinis TaxID=143900 RepID=A0AAD7R4K2_9TELE|nr:hypothetical protein AAFF_G00376060 [Aldrovandia affinis]